MAVQILKSRLSPYPNSSYTLGKRLKEVENKERKYQSHFLEAAKHRITVNELRESKQ
jgi:hypothetical protein